MPSDSPPARPSDRPAPRAAATRGRRPRVADDAQTDALREQVLVAAIDEFSEHGHAGARIERISRAAGTVDRMLYYYFGNKDGLYQAALERIYERMIAAERDFRMPADPEEAMRQLVVHAWDHYVAHPEMVRLLMNENLLRARFIGQSDQVRRTALPLVQTVRTIVEAGQARGVFRADINVEHTLMTIMSLGFFYVANQHTCSTWLGGNLMSRPRRAAWREHICAVVLASLR